MTTMERVTADLRQRSIWYKLGWWFLVLIAGASLVNHVVGALGLYGGEEMKFSALAAVNIYALAVLLIPYRHGERWAWWVTWVLVPTYAVVIFDSPVAGPYYLGTAGLMALAQLSTWSAFEQP